MEAINRIVAALALPAIVYVGYEATMIVAANSAGTWGMWFTGATALAFISQVCRIISFVIEGNAAYGIAAR